MTTPTPPERAGAPAPPSAAPSPHADPLARRRAKRPKRFKLTLYVADKGLVDALNAEAVAQDRSVSWVVVNLLTKAMPLRDVERPALEAQPTQAQEGEA